MYNNNVALKKVLLPIIVGTMAAVLTRILYPPTAQLPDYRRRGGSEGPSPILVFFVAGALTFAIIMVCTTHQSSDDAQMPTQPKVETDFGSPKHPAQDQEGGGGEVLFNKMLQMLDVTAKAPF